MFKKRLPAKISPITDNPLRNPGQSLDEELQRIWEDDIFVSGGTLVFTFGRLIYEWVRWLLKTNVHPLVATLLLIPWIVFLVFKLYRIK